MLASAVSPPNAEAVERISGHEIPLLRGIQI